MGRFFLLFATVYLIPVISCSESVSCDATAPEPVCGDNGIKFHNPCWLELYNGNGNAHVTQVDMSECEATAYDETCFCPYIYRPVVAYDSSTDTKRTYANACTYRCEAKSSRNLHFVFCGSNTDGFDQIEYSQCL